MDGVRCWRIWWIQASSHQIGLASSVCFVSFFSHAVRRTHTTAHIPFAHHNLQGTRNDAIPIINMSVPTEVNENGFDMSFEDRTMQMHRQGRADFRAPYRLHHVGDFIHANG